ncbi:hypothetical protein PENSPDRAFT_608397 [Peniophora sp. CONT]|nr:hypothetical protein PENSPDRAFT_608397 [Peniophora sp. CONT]
MALLLTLDWPAPSACKQLSGAYRHPFYDRNLESLTQRREDVEGHPSPANERNMCALSAVLRSKPQWWIKYTCPDIRARWKSEAVGAPVPYGDIPLNEDEVDYVLDELAHYAAMRDPATGVEASIATRIWQSDNLIDDGLREELLVCVKKLENVSDELKDWHPRANGQVLDLVHPSMYPAIYGRTLISSSFPRPRETPRLQYTVEPSSITLPVPYGETFKLDSDFYQHLTSNFHDAADIGAAFLSKRFQWLPTDFAVSPDGMSARALGYINNLEPCTHATTYQVLENLVARFVPLWERVLGETAAGYLPPVRTKGLYKQKYARRWTEEEFMSGEGPPFVIVLPRLRGSFEGHPAPATVRLNGRILQVIVKLANIHLTTENPEYPGGSWHVEGMINEAIVSTGIYYYDEDNTTESRLAFRTAVDDFRMSYHQDDDVGIKTTYGINPDEPLLQTLGAVVTKAGRCIAFPNMYQHQVQPFSLVDRSRPGHRKILALFLVDPNLEHPRPSTTVVPAQQREWMYAAVHTLAASPDSRLSRLPVELLDAIVDKVEGLMDRSEAEALRLELMDERSVMTERNTEEIFSLPFNMCEH